MVSELQPGDPQTMGPYRLVGRLGEGGMGQVFLGVSPGGRPVAVKAIRAELTADPEFRVRFRREVAAAQQVSGVFTAAVVNSDVDGPVAWLATAYVPGPSLAEAVDSHGPLPEGSVLALAAGLAESLTAIHAAGVVHRDLKPSNVLLAQDGPHVIDFGISRAAESTTLTRTGLVIGSPGFMSPEQATGGDIGKPTDIFSLGTVLAFAATGEGPFGEGTTAALLYRVVSGTPDLHRVPTAIRPLVERCLAKDPGQRPTAPDLLAEAGAVQPAGNWLPDSLTRTFPRDIAPAAAFAPPDPAPATASWPGYATLPTATSPAVRVAARGSRLLAETSIDSPGVTPGSPPPPGDAPERARPGRRNRPRRLLVLACVIGVILGTSAAAAFAMTSPTGQTPSPVQAKAALTFAPIPSASDGQATPAVSSAGRASQAVVSASGASSSTSQSATTPAMPTSTTSSPTPPPATTSPTPPPATSSPTPRPATTSPTPRPATTSPTPAPATTSPTPAPATSSPTPAPTTSSPTPSSATSSSATSASAPSSPSASALQ